MNAGLLRFKLLGFPVEVQPTFWLLLVLYALVEDPGWAMLGWPLAITVGVLVHELGHAAVSRWFGLRVGAIELNGLGGLVTHAPTTPGRQLAISLAGPAAGVALGLLALAASALPASPTVHGALLEPLLLVNLFYGLVNLMPGYPLDGGNALGAALTPLTGRVNAEKATAGIGMLLGFALVYYGLVFGAWWTWFFAFLILAVNYQVLRRNGAL